MVGTPVIAGAIAQLAFWVLVIVGVATGALKKLSTSILLMLWLVGFIGLPRIAWWTGPLVTPWVAVLDIVLVFIVVKGDVRLT